MRKRKRTPESTIDPASVPPRKPRPITFADLMYILDLNHSALDVSISYKGKCYNMLELLQNADNIQILSRDLYVTYVGVAMLNSPVGDGIVPSFNVCLSDVFIEGNGFIRYEGVVS